MIRQREPSTPVSVWPPKSDSDVDSEPAAGERRVELVERLFREHNDALVRFVRARVGTHQEALEIAQEAYVRMLSLDEPGAVSYLRTFLFRTAANIAIDRQRRHRTQTQVTEQPQLRESRELRTPERRVAGEQTLNRLHSLIAALPPKCRLSFVWHQIHGLDVATVAQRLGITESMVRKYVVRALLHCRERMDLEELEPRSASPESRGPGGLADE
jgi:RNA polymerase sigma factor (sigma-70 family)